MMLTGAGLAQSTMQGVGPHPENGAKFRSADGALAASRQVLINGIIGIWEFGRSGSRARFRKMVLPKDQPTSLPS
jgi:hypothetical protein